MSRLAQPCAGETTSLSLAHPIADAASLHHRPTHTIIDLRHIDAAFTGRRRLLDATATISLVAREAHVRPPPPSPAVTTAQQPHHSPAPPTRTRRPQSATTARRFLQCPWTSALPNASVARTARRLRPRQRLPLLRSTRTRRRLRFTCHLHGTRNLHRSSREVSHSLRRPAHLATRDT